MAASWFRCSHFSLIYLISISLLFFFFFFSFLLFLYQHVHESGAYYTCRDSNHGNTNQAYQATQ